MYNSEISALAGDKDGDIPNIHIYKCQNIWKNILKSLDGQSLILIIGFNPCRE
jgi:hypothetical protein